MSSAPLEPVYSDAWADDLKAVVKAATRRECWDLDEVPDTTPDAYTELHLSRRYVESSPRLGGLREDFGWRLTLRFVANTTQGVRHMQDRTVARMRARVVLGGVSTIVQFESPGQSLEFDDGYYTASTDFIFVR